MNTKRLTTMALLTAAALIIHVIEAQLPLIVPIPGIKLGLSNIVTVCAMFLLGPADALGILLCRIFWGSVFSGQMTVFLYSLGGGLLCYLTLLLFRRLVGAREVWVTGVAGAIAHNIGQIAVAAAVMKTTVVFWYLPALILIGVFTGLFTGLCSQFFIQHLRHIGFENLKGGEQCNRLASKIQKNKIKQKYKEKDGINEIQ
ncbi:MAG: heptaprenyl diphosphate synthase [Oscillospiraceae bacterium]|nr:heptaprenyl diphosphate synthase [Oscillospiraceae bacterium]